MGRLVSKDWFKFIGNYQVLILLSYLTVSVLLLRLAVVNFVSPVFAQTKSPSSERLRILKEQGIKDEIETTPEATVSTAKEATSASLTKKVVEKEPDLTESKSEVQGKLDQYLEEQAVGTLSVTNPLKHAIRLAVARGVPTNTIVLILLFPLVAAWVTFTRHVIGLAGFGIFTPAILAVLFLATGVFSGIILFASIIFSATTARLFLRRVKLQYLPRIAFLLWFVSLTVFGLILMASFISLPGITVISIFPILILILLTETFMEVQIKEGMKQAASKTFITVLVAIGGYWFLQLEFLQKFVLLQPELSVILVGLFDIVIGKYTGLRWLEYYKFRQILKSSKETKK